MFHSYSLFFLNGRADKNLRTGPGAILAVIAGYCRSVKTELLCIESMRIVVVTGNEELLHGRHEAISGLLSSSRLCINLNARTTYTARILSGEQRVTLYCVEPPSTVQTFIAGVFDTFLIHQAVHRVQTQKQMAAEEGCSRVCGFYNSQKENT